jgi:large subunit ribosomal protein L28
MLKSHLRVLFETQGGVQMAKCDICQKGIFFGRKIRITRSQISRRALTRQKPNIRKVKVVVDGVPTTKRVCTRCLRSGLVQRA